MLRKTEDSAATIPTQPYLFWTSQDGASAKVQTISKILETDLGGDVGRAGIVQTKESEAKNYKPLRE